MNDLAASIEEINASARATFGKDINILLARAPAFGHTDICMIISGREQTKAAAAMAGTLSKPKVTEETVTFMGKTLKTTILTGSARNG